MLADSPRDCLVNESLLDFLEFGQLLHQLLSHVLGILIELLDFQLLLGEVIP
jgi:hypothetical protein